MACELTDLLVMLQLWLLIHVTIQACDPPCLYFSAGLVIKSIELSSKEITSNVTEPQAHDGRVLAIAVDVEEQTLYFSYQVSRTIKRIDLKSSKIEDVASEVGHCEDIAIDWVNKYIYWTDNKNGRIEMSRVDGSDRKLLFDRDVQYLRGITVDPVHGYMFWTDYGNNPKIERSTLAGQERTTIIANTAITRLKYPNDVIVDYTSNRIYWVDGGLNVIGTADLNGRNIMISEPIKNSQLFALALYNNTFYITDSEMNARSIIVVNKESLREVDRFTQPIIGSRDLFGLTMLHESRQPPVISNCSHGNGGCSHLCFIVPDGFRCGCPNGTALREDGYSCQEANFTNCRSLPCQNGGTCYFNFHSFTDDCACSKYYTGKDCGLYLGSGAVRITLEMKVKELEAEKFKQAIKGGLDDYCTGGNCNVMRLNKTIFMQFCRTFLNGSAFDAFQVAIIGKPTASLPNHTNVDFAVILRPVSSSKPVVVVNTTLEHIVRERADSISKRLGGFETIFVNNLHPVSCNDDGDVGSTSEVPANKEKNRDFAPAIGISLSVAIVLLFSFTVAVWKWRRRGDEQRDDEEHEYDYIGENGQGEAIGAGGYENMEGGGANEEEDRGDYEIIEENVPEGGAIQRSRGGYESMERGVIVGERNQGEHEHIEEDNEPERRESQRPVDDYERLQRDGDHEENDFIEQNEMHAPGLSTSNILDKKNFNNFQASLRLKRRGGGMVNWSTVDNQRRKNNHEYVNELFRKNTVNEENEVSQKNGNQQSDGAYEDTSASQHHETSDGTQGAPGQCATPRNVDKRDVSSNQDNKMSMSGGLETRRQPVENDDHPIQCKEDQEENLH